MCRAMAKLGHQVTLMLPGAESHLLISKENSDFSFKTVIYEVNSKLMSDSKYYFGLKNYFKGKKTKKYDVIYTRKFIVYFFAARFFPHTRLIFEIHENCFHSNKVLNTVYISLFRMIYNEKTQLLVTISHALAEYWSAWGILKSRILIYHDCVSYNVNEVKPNKHVAREQVKVELGSYKLLAVYTGNIGPNRGIDKIIGLGKAFPDILFIIAGGPESMINFYKEKFELSRNIFFMGFVNIGKVKLLQASADILLAFWSDQLSTINYCSPLKIFEYMNAERVILVHRFKTILEVLEDGKDCVMINDPNDPEETIDKMRIAIANLGNEKMIRTAKNKIVKKYNWNDRAIAILNTISNE